MIYHWIVDKSKDSSSSRSRGIIRRIALLYLVAFVFGAWGIAIGRYELFPFQLIKPYGDEIKSLLARVSLTEGFPRIYHLQEKQNRFGYLGFKQQDTNFVDTGYLLLSRYSIDHDQAIVELIRLRDFQTIHKWIPPIDEILDSSTRFDSFFRSPHSIDEYRMRHPLLLEDGDLVFHSEPGALVKIDQQSNIVWIVDEEFHHSIQMSHDGNLVVCNVNRPNLIDVSTKYRDDGFAIITQNGEVIQRYSVGKILIDNGYRGLFFGAGMFKEDRLHLNDAQPILQDIGEARVGDIALSIRHLSTVLLYRPITDEIKWLKTGPWLNQHDIDLLNDGDYSVFGNNMYRLQQSKEIQANEISEIYVFDPTTNTVKTPFTRILKQVAM